MKEKILIEMREELKSAKRDNEQYNREAARLKELKKDEKVQEYLKLVSHYGKDDIEAHQFDEKDTIDTIYYYAMRKIHKESTNGIYVYLGTYRYIDLSEYDDGIDELVRREDKRAYKREYLNLEQRETISIPIEECDDFESENIILYLSDDEEYYKNDAKDNAKRIQMEFATIAIKESQEKAVKQMIKRYGNRKLGEYWCLILEMK